MATQHSREIRDELARILQSPHFAASKRCQDFLTFVVEHALAKDFDSLTERSIGAQLFGRPIDYDTGSDAVVRVRANAVRQRLAQYYATLSAHAGLRIQLSSGSYVPGFSAAEIVEPAAESSSANHPVAWPTAKALWMRLRVCSHFKPAVGLLTLVLILAVTWTWWAQSSLHRNAQARFWYPVIASHRTVTFRMGDTVTYWISSEFRRNVKSGSSAVTAKPGDVLESWDDSASAGSVRCILQLSNFLSAHGVSSRLRWPQEIQSTELDQDNVIYLGAFNNSWTVSLNQNLPFHFEETDTPAGHLWMIREKGNQKRIWSLTKTYPQSIEHDYALITRLLDLQKNRVILTIGGLNHFGTQASAEFLTNEDDFEAFARTLPSGWEKRNLQIVMEMGISANRVVTPKVVAYTVW